jgi:hypothetical protein
MLRLKGFEFGGGLEFSRPLIAPAGAASQWAGTISGSYTNLKTNDGTFSLSPIVDLSVTRGLLLGAGVGAEASIQLVVLSRLIHGWYRCNAAARATCS